MNNYHPIVEKQLEARIMEIAEGSSAQDASPYYTARVYENGSYLVRSGGHVAWEYLRDRGYKDIPECFCEECVLRRKSDSEGN